MAQAGERSDELTAEIPIPTPGGVQAFASASGTSSDDVNRLRRPAAGADV